MAQNELAIVNPKSRPDCECDFGTLIAFVSDQGPRKQECRYANSIDHYFYPLPIEILKPHAAIQPSLYSHFARQRASDHDAKNQESSPLPKDL